MATLRKSVLALIDENSKDGNAGIISQLLAFEALGQSLSPFDAFPLVLDFLRTKIATTIVFHSPVRRITCCPRGVLAGTEDGSVAVIGPKGEFDLLGKHKKPICSLCGLTEVYASGSEDGSIKVWNLNKLVEMTTFAGHTNAVLCMTMLVDGETIVSGGEDCTLRVWSLKDMRESSVLSGHQGAVTQLAVTTENTHLVSASIDGTIKLWELYSWQDLGTMTGHSQAVTSLVFSLGSEVLISASLDSDIRVWNWSTCELRKTVSGHKQGVLCLALTPSGEQLVSGSQDHTIKVWSVLEDFCEEVTLTGHMKDVETVTITRNGIYIFSGSADATVKVWCLADFKEVVTLKTHSDAVLAMTLLPDNKGVATGSKDTTVKIWTYHDFPDLRTIGNHGAAITSLAMSPDGLTVVTASSDGTIKVWDTRLLALKATLCGHTQSVSSVQIFHDGERVASGSDDSTVRIWSLVNFKEIAMLKGHSMEVTKIAVSPDSFVLISISTDKCAKVWSTESMKELAALKGHIAAIVTLVIAKNGRYAATGSLDCSVKVWSIVDFSLVISLNFHSAPISGLYFTPKCDYLISAADDGTVKVWQERDYKEAFTFASHTKAVHCISLSADEKRLITASEDKVVKVWDFTTGVEVATLYGHKEGIGTLALTSDSQFAVTGSSDYTVKIWSVDYMREMATFAVHSKRVTKVVLAKDEKSVVSAGEDGLLQIVNLSMKIPAMREMAKPPLNSFLSSIGINSLTASAMDRLKHGNLIHRSVALCSIKPYYFNALHVCSYFNHSLTLDEYLHMGVPILRGSFGSPLTLALKRNTIKCVNAILEHLITLCEENRSWNEVQEITDDLPKLLLSNTPQLTAFFGLLLRPSSQPKLPHFIVPTKELPIINLSPNWFIQSKLFEDSESGEQQEVVEFLVSDIRWNLEIGSAKSLEFLAGLENCDDPKVLTTAIVRALIISKWEKLMPMTLSLTMLYAGLLFCMVWVVFKYGDPALTKGVFLGINCFFLLYEGVQSIVHGTDYWKDPWNYLDWVRSSVCMLWVLYLEGYRYVELLAVCMCFLRGFTYFRTFKMTRMFVRMTLEVVKEMYSFLVIFAYTTIAFGMMYAVLVPDEITGAFGAWMTAYELLMGTYTTEGFGTLQWLCFTSASLVNVIIMLNLLISILGDAYEHAQMSSKENDTLEQLRIIIEYESMLFWRREMGTPSVLIKCWAMEDASGKAEWEGKVTQITKLVKEDVKRTQAREEDKCRIYDKKFLQLHEKMTALDGRFSTIPALTATLEKRYSEVEMKLEDKVSLVEERLEGRLGEMEEKLDQLLRAIEGSD